MLNLRRTLFRVHEDHVLETGRRGIDKRVYVGYIHLFGAPTIYVV
jgi:hypothetical protein